MEMPQQQVMTPANDETAIKTLGKLGDLGKSLSFLLHSTKISQECHELFKQQTVKGNLVAMGQNGATVATLAYESAQRGRHLRASLALPTGETIVTLEMGIPPKPSPEQKDGIGGFFNNIGDDYNFSAPPPIMIELLGQPYGSFSLEGHNGWCGGCQLTYADGSLGASIPEPEYGTCCFGLCTSNALPGTVSRKESSLGKTEVRKPVQFSGGREADGTVIHLLMDSNGPKMPKELKHACEVQEVLCELGGGLGDREKLDVVLMAASLTAFHITAQWNEPARGTAGPPA